ncbi:hypothetical protein AB0D66_12970 [Streptomyces sp. NPDC048270]|uniref:hypothetical protein n=1 Tax=Streptomyces sp. NPDC048270 TaxID=3154615 RepID=UPI0033FABA09
MLDIAFRRPPNFAPDASFGYSGIDYALLGLVAETAGRPPAQQFHDRLVNWPWCKRRWARDSIAGQLREG